MKGKLMVAVLAGILLFPVLGMADQMEGTIQGFNCVVLGKACPIDREDPMVGLETGFVLLLPDNTYYLIPNLDRAILARHILHRVRVTGKIDKKHRSIQAEKLEHWDEKKGEWKVTWSREMEEEIRKYLRMGT